MKRRTFRISDDGHIGNLARLLSQRVQAEKVTEVIVQDYRKKRTLAQNAYLWAVVYQAMADDTGHSPEEIHEIMKHKFCPPRIVEIQGEEHPVYSTAKLTTTEMIDYIDRVTAWAATELGLQIPEWHGMAA